MSEDEEIKIRWRKVADDHWVARHADYHLFKVKSYRGHQWDLYWGDPTDNPDHPGKIGYLGTKKAVNAYLERRYQSDMAEAAKKARAEEQSRRAKRSREDGVAFILIPTTPKPDTVELFGVDPRVAHLVLHEYRDEQHRRCWIVHVTGSMFQAAGYDWRIGVIVEGIDAYWMRHSYHLPKRDDEAKLDEGIPWDYHWHRFAYGGLGLPRRDQRDEYARRLASWVFSRGAIMMRDDCRAREEYTEARAEAQAESRAKAEAEEAAS